MSETAGFLENVDTGVWHYRVQVYTFGKVPFKHVCPYFHMIYISIMLAPVRFACSLLWKLLKVVFGPPLKTLDKIIKDLDKRKAYANGLVRLEMRTDLLNELEVICSMPLTPERGNRISRILEELDCSFTTSVRIYLQSYKFASKLAVEIPSVPRGLDDHIEGYVGYLLVNNKDIRNGLVKESLAQLNTTSPYWQAAESAEYVYKEIAALDGQYVARKLQERREAPQNWFYKNRVELLQGFTKAFTVGGLIFVGGLAYSTTTWLMSIWNWQAIWSSFLWIIPHILGTLLVAGMAFMAFLGVMAIISAIRDRKPLRELAEKKKAAAARDAARQAKFNAFMDFLFDMKDGICPEINFIDKEAQDVEASS